MKTRLLSILLSLLCVVTSPAKDLPSYPMDKLVLAAPIVVYCDETEVSEATGRRTLTKCKILQSFKGGLEVGSELTASYGLFLQRRAENHAESKPLPKGKALLVSQKDESGTYLVMNAKLIADRKVYGFVQFDNPGALYLVPQNPENLKLADGPAYGEKEHLEDLGLALKKSAGQTLKPDEVHLGRPF
jgi:hypothetical protein